MDVERTISRLKLSSIANTSGSGKTFGGASLPHCLGGWVITLGGTAVSALTAANARGAVIKESAEHPPAMSLRRFIGALIYPFPLGCQFGTR
jgi:hypothetical protein